MLAKMSESNSDAQIQAAFELFDTNGDKFICYDDLKKVAEELGENMTEEELLEMIAGAAGKKAGGEDEGRVSQSDFCTILKMATST